MPVDESARLDEGHRGQRALGNIVVQVRGVLDMRLADVRIGHDRGVVLERVADVAVLVALLTDRPVVELVRIGHVVVPLVPVVLPRNMRRQEAVADAGRGGGWNGEHGVVRIGVGVGVAAVAEVARVIVVQQVVVPWLAARIDRSRKRLQVFHDRRHARLREIRAVGVGAAAV